MLPEQAMNWIMPSVTPPSGPPSASVETKPASAGGVVAGMEVLASVALFHYCTWIIGPGVEKVGDALAYLSILVLSALYVLLRPSPGSATPLVLSLPKPNIQGIIVFSAITTVVFTALWLFRLEVDPGWKKVGIDALKYLPLATVQVIWLYLFLLPRLRHFVTAICGESQALGDKAVCLILALIFAFNHLPNLMLTICAGGIGLVWTMAYLKSPNPYLLTLCHAVLASAYLHFLGKSTRVGLGYWNSGHHAFNKSLRLVTHWVFGVF
jgi:hypothetical protein